MKCSIFICNALNVSSLQRLPVFEAMQECCSRTKRLEGRARIENAKFKKDMNARKMNQELDEMKSCLDLELNKMNRLNKTKFKGRMTNRGSVVECHRSESGKSKEVCVQHAIGEKTGSTIVQQEQNHFGTARKSFCLSSIGLARQRMVVISMPADAVVS